MPGVGTRHANCSNCRSIHESQVHVFVIAMRSMFFTILLAAALGKLRSRERFREFATWVRELPVPGARLPSAPSATVGAEALVTMLLVPPSTARLGLAATAALFAVFAVGTDFVRRSGKSVECLCFGSGGGQIGSLHVARDAMLCALSAVAAALADDASWLTGSAETWSFIVLGMLAAGFIVSLEDLAALARRPA